MEIIEHTTKETSEVISESALFDSIQQFAENSPSISKALVNKKFDLMDSMNKSNIEKINKLIYDIDKKIDENQRNIDSILVDIDYYIAKIKKHLM